MCGCGTKTTTGCGINLFEFSDLNLLAKNIGQSISTESIGAEGAAHPTTKMFVREGGIGISKTSNDGLSGVFIFTFIGIPITVKWEATVATLPPNEVDATIQLDFYVKDVPYYTFKTHLRCDDLAKPEACTFEITDETVSEFGFKGCNKGCLKKCAPDCIWCGGSWECWAICSAYCAAKCCL